MPLVHSMWHWPGVAFDLSPLEGEPGGVRRYVEQLAAQLPGAGVEIIPLSAGGIGGRGPRLRPTLAWLQAVAPLQILRSGCRLAHFGSGRASLLCPCPSVLTVHDLSALLWPDYYPWRERLLVRPWLDRSIRRAAAIIAVSDDTAAALQARYPGLRAQVERIHPAVAPCFFISAPASAFEAEARALEARGPIWLHVSGPTLRKNSARVLEAFAMALFDRGSEAFGQLHAIGRPLLVVAGRLPGSISRELRAYAGRLGIGASLRWVLDASDARMSRLYQLAQQLVAPSLHEGFGLVPLEAMASGTPVIVADRGATREVCGDAALYVDASDAASIAAGMLRLAGDAPLRHQLSALGRQRAARFCWDRNVQATASVYRRLLDRLPATDRSVEAG